MSLLSPQSPFCGEARTNIAIIGFGRMGSWIGRELSKRHDVFVYDTDKKKTAGIRGLSVLEKPEDLRNASPRFLINAVRLPDTVGAFRATESLLPLNCVLCDLASVKENVAAFYRSQRRKFFSCHPMFGPTFADLGCLKNETVVIIRESDAESAAFFRLFFASLGLAVHDYSFDEHDRMIAYSLALPFVSTMVFSACLDRMPVPGTTFKRHLDIALKLMAEDDSLLAEILFSPHALSQLEKVTHKLEFLKHVIRAKDGEEARRFFRVLREHIGVKSGASDRPSLG